ncbi:uncharacterized protein MEPE_06308 [Melanopsichium pennsylvanicum]|uniref:S1 motif domain-containing protein n=2 Tax=Melanopsichium pennsylvanicum TaxID=63383 RepID=A0AAJ5C8I5_9BASI|nr:putative protein [Melanopsichium pennsylvanicum 4]SNX87598.1 uncharacterized protein MEPE_06308 [Melanopsichium pennsylvanicum]
MTFQALLMITWLGLALQVHSVPVYGDHPWNHFTTAQPGVGSDPLFHGIESDINAGAYSGHFLPSVQAEFAQHYPHNAYQAPLAAKQEQLAHTWNPVQWTAPDSAEPLSSSHPWNREHSAPGAVVQTDAYHWQNAIQPHEIDQDDAVMHDLGFSAQEQDPGHVSSSNFNPEHSFWPAQPYAFKPDQALPSSSDGSWDRLSPGQWQKMLEETPLTLAERQALAHVVPVVQQQAQFRQTLQSAADTAAQTWNVEGAVEAKKNYVPTRTAVQDRIDRFVLPSSPKYLNPNAKGASQYMVSMPGGQKRKQTLRIAATANLADKLSSSRLSGTQLLAQSQSWPEMGLRVKYAQSPGMFYGLIDAEHVKGYFPDLPEQDKRMLNKGDIAVVKIRRIKPAEYTYRLYSVLDRELFKSGVWIFL